jgi:hypothetical protein
MYFEFAELRVVQLLSTPPEPRRDTIEPPDHFSERTIEVFEKPRHCTFPKAIDEAFATPVTAASPSNRPVTIARFAEAIECTMRRRNQPSRAAFFGRRPHVVPP